MAKENEVFIFQKLSVFSSQIEIAYSIGYQKDIKQKQQKDLTSKEYFFLCFFYF